MVGDVLCLLGKSRLVSPTWTPANPSTYLATDDVSIRRDGKAFLTYPYFFDEEGRFTEGVTLCHNVARSASHSDALVDHVCVDGFWLLNEANLENVGDSDDDEQLAAIGSSIWRLDWDFSANPQRLVTVYADTFTGACGSRSVSMWFFEDMYCVIDYQDSTRFGRTEHAYRDSAIVGDSLYAIPIEDSSCIHEFRLAELRHLARWTDELIPPNFQPPRIVSEIHRPGRAIDLASQGNLLLVLEIAERADYDRRQVNLINTWDDRLHYRIAAFHECRMIAGFEPSIDDKSFSCRRIDASYDKVILGVAPSQGGAVVLQGGTLGEWNELPPLRW